MSLLDKARAAPSRPIIYKWSTKPEEYDLREVAIALLSTDVSHSSGRLLEEDLPSRKDSPYFLSTDIEFAAWRWIAAVADDQPPPPVGSFGTNLYEPKESA